MQHSRRSLDTSFYHDPYVESLSRNEQDLFLTIMLNPLNNLAGIYEISVAKLSQYSKMSPDEVKGALHKLQNDGKVHYVDSWMAIKNHIKNQAINPNMAQNILEIMRDCPAQSKIFVLMRPDGEPEGWLSEFRNKVSEYLISKSKKEFYKNRKNKDLDFETPKYLTEITVDQVLSTIMSNSRKNISNNKPLPNPYQRLREEEDEMEVENEERKGSMKNEDEGEFMSDEELASLPDYHPLRHKELWNSFEHLPKFTQGRLTISGVDVDEARKSCDGRTFEDIQQAIKNYAAVMSEPESYGNPYPFKRFANFLANHGVENFSIMPRKKQNQKLGLPGSDKDKDYTVPPEYQGGTW